jgi:Tfp pilus assembly protein PilX
MQRKEAIVGKFAQAAKTFQGDRVKNIRFLLTDERGMILFISLTILCVLLAAGIGIRTMLQNDYRVLANLRGGTEVFYYAAAGIEWSKSEVARTLSLPPVPANQTVGFQSGVFSVAFISPSSHGPLAASVVVRSTGSLGPSSHVVQAQLTKAYDLADAALVLRGNGKTVNLTGSPIFISGADYDPTAGSVAPGAKPRPAISTSDEALRGLVQQALGNPPQDILDGAGLGLVTSEYLSVAAMSQFADGVCASPSAIVTGLPPSGDLVVENQTWGTPASPELRCFEGSSAGGDALTVAGNIAGAGVLIVKNADLALSGSFRWEGLIIVTGEEVGLMASGPADKEINGGVIVNEVGNPGSTKAILDIQGNFRLRFSRSGLASSAGFISTSMLEQAAPALPFVITQNYWRTVTP